MWRISVNQRAQHTLDANSSNRAVPRARSGDEQRSNGEYTALGRPMVHTRSKRRKMKEEQ